jgi:anti-anti-sigma factor
MVVDFEFSGDVCILRLHGRFATGQDSAYLRTKTEDVKKSGCSKVLADFTEVSYIDSTGIGFLIGIYTSVTRNPEGMFVLANPNHRVLDVLELCRLNTVIPIFPDLASAMQALQQGRHVSASS